MGKVWEQGEHSSLNELSGNRGTEMMVRKAGAVDEKRKRKGMTREAEKERGGLEGRGKQRETFRRTAAGAFYGAHP